MAPMQSARVKPYNRRSTYTSSHSTGRGIATSSACWSSALAALACKDASAGLDQR